MYLDDKNIIETKIGPYKIVHCIAIHNAFIWFLLTSRYTKHTDITRAQQLLRWATFWPQ